MTKCLDKIDKLEKHLIYLKCALSKHPSIEKAGIFGAPAMELYKNGSGIDLAIYGKNITPKAA